MARKAKDIIHRTVARTTIVIDVAINDEYDLNTARERTDAAVNAAITAITDTKPGVSGIQLSYLNSESNLKLVHETVKLDA